MMNNKIVVILLYNSQKKKIGKAYNKETVETDKQRERERERMSEREGEEIRRFKSIMPDYGDTVMYLLVTKIQRGVFQQYFVDTLKKTV